MGKYGKDWCACGDYLIGTPHECKFNQSTSERIGQVQAALFAIREDLRDTLDDAKDARFIRLAA